MNRKHKTIISASRRTDIPAFYSEWFMNRIRQGYCIVPNPMYPKQKTKPISLRPEDVEIIVFWTRDPGPLMKYLSELDERGYKYYFQYTILGYPREIDPKCPSVDRAIKTFLELSDRIGKEKVIWRYDPILFSNLTPLPWHKDQIEKIFGKLKGKTEQMVISFIDPYRKTKIRLEKETSKTFTLDDHAFEAKTYLELGKWIGSSMPEKGIRVVTCAEPMDLSCYGIEHGKCIDNALIQRIIDRKVTSSKDPAQRKACGCVKSKDIGSNNTCRFGCKYCYATNTPKSHPRGEG
ncbi:MAG: DUF1848 domain-containing protein [Candidatus Omnitrophota bacterium]